MASFSRKTGILGALAIAGVLIVGALVLSSNASLFSPGKANAESTQALLQAYAQKDSDNDGLPDWEEALYGLDPHNAHSFSPNMTDGEAVSRGLVKPKFMTATATTTDTSTIPATTAAPNSLTDQFAQSLFTQIVSQSNGTEPTPAQITQFAQAAITSLVQAHTTQNKYSLSDEKKSTGGPDTLRTYIATIESALAKNNPHTTKSEIDYFSDAVNTSDTSGLASVAKIGAAYAAEAPAVMNISVPSEAQYAHLELANAFARMGEDISNMSAMNTDPLRAYLGLAAYKNDAPTFIQAFADMNSVLQSEQVQFSDGQPGRNFYLLLQNAAKQQTPVNASAGNTSP
jgi:hypothetical protein